MIDLQEVWDKYGDEYLKFGRVENPLYPRPDIAAFLLLDKLVPTENSSDMVCAASHDEIFLNTSVFKLAKVATEEDILTLIRCGVRLVGGDYLAMFV
jgi:hypothetical protein